MVKKVFFVVLVDCGCGVKKLLFQKCVALLNVQILAVVVIENLENHL